MEHLAFLLVVYGITTLIVIIFYCLFFIENLKYHWNWKTGNRILYPYLISGIIAIYYGFKIMIGLNAL